jgi:hypothetical protein
MRLLSARWALVALAVLVVAFAGYGLNRGILIGSRIEAAKLSDDYPFYKKHCRYLFFTGVKQVWTSAESTREDAEKDSCAALKPEPVIRRRHKPSNS